MKNKNNYDPTKIAFQKLAASFVIIVGLIVFLSTTNTITGRVIGGTSKITILDIFIALWGLLIIGVGLWMWRYKKFHESIFDKQ
ncbi:MAG: hypothetical protein QXW97_02020 [Candidatus Pacearchaeota archaeon]